MELMNIINTELASLIAKTSSYEFKKFIYSDEQFCIGYSATYKEIHVWADDGNTALLTIEEVEDLTVASKDIYDELFVARTVERELKNLILRVDISPECTVRIAGTVNGRKLSPKKHMSK